MALNSLSLLKLLLNLRQPTDQLPWNTQEQLIMHFVDELIVNIINLYNYAIIENECRMMNGFTHLKQQNRAGEFAPL